MNHSVKSPKLRFTTHTIGIDEVGRGPIAGPVAVGAFIFNGSKAQMIFACVKESKQLSEKKREEWFSKILVAQKSGLVDFQVSFQSEKTIDKRGLSYAVRNALHASLSKIVKRNHLCPNKVKVLLDGGLKAPSEYENQQTIIKGDEKKKVIALASICAKVMRDRRMNRLSKKYPQYGFEVHKGYGTKKHYEAIRKGGLLATHRRSFLRKLIGG